MGIQWRDNLAIGVEVIDNQHKELLAHFDRLLTACEKGKGVGELSILLTFLDDYVVRHFSDEENIQQKHKYPGYADHKREHDAFVTRLKTLKDEINSQGVALHNVIETNSLLLAWLLNHISKVDAKLGIFLKASGA